MRRWRHGDRAYAFAGLGLMAFAVVTTPRLGTMAYPVFGRLGLFTGLLVRAFLFFKPDDLSTDGLWLGAACPPRRHRGGEAVQEEGLPSRRL